MWTCRYLLTHCMWVGNMTKCAMPTSISMFQMACFTQGLRCCLRGTMPKANTADIWRADETRHSGAPWKQLSWHAYTYIQRLRSVSGERLDSGSGSPNTPSSCFHKEKMGAATERKRGETQQGDGEIEWPGQKRGSMWNVLKVELTWLFVDRKRTGTYFNNWLSVAVSFQSFSLCTIYTQRKSTMVPARLIRLLVGFLCHIFL